MAVITVGKNEVSLNGTKYPILGRVGQQLTSIFPTKQVLGDYSKDSDPYLSSWSVDDQRGGILVEELNEQTQNNRAWYSIADLSYKGITLPPLVTQADSVAAAPTVTNADFELTTGWTGGARSAVVKHGGTYSWVVGNATAYQTLAWSDSYRGVAVSVKVWMYLSGASTSSVRIYDGVDTTTTTYNTATTWAEKTVTHVFNAAATEFTIQLVNDSDANVCYFDDLTTPLWTVGAPTTWANFNDKLYCGFGATLGVLNSAGTGFNFRKNFPATITALIPSLNNRLYVFLGDTENYWYMATTELFTVSNSTDATEGIQWDAKLFKMNASGTAAYSVNPDNATPTWTAAGNITDLSTTDLANGKLEIYQDASGNDIIYFSHPKGIKAYDFTNKAWLDTQLKLPDHPDGGKGFIAWNGSLYVSSGMDITEYTIGETATVREVGLNQDDGLPSLADGGGGSIVQLVNGLDKLYAIVDGTAVSGTCLYVYDGQAWQKWGHSIGTVTIAPNGGIMSSAYGYRLWISTANAVWYMDVGQELRKPKKSTTHTYRTAGAHYTPWFDADWAAGDKLALKFRVNTDDCTDTESIEVRYRVNYVATNISSSWTSLGTITTDGTTTYTFGSSLEGLEFKSIQFRFVMLRGTTTTTSPILRWYSLSYLKQITPSWGYRFTVDCTKAYNSKSRSQLVDALKTAAETATLIEFGFRNDTGATQTYRGQIREVTGSVETGLQKEGIYDVFLIVP